MVVLEENIETTNGVIRFGEKTCEKVVFVETIPPVLITK